MPSAQTSPAIVALTVTRPVPARQARHRHGRCSSNRLYPSGQNANYKFPGPQAASFEVGRASLEAGCMHLFECEATFEAEPAEVWKVWTDVDGCLSGMSARTSPGSMA